MGGKKATRINMGMFRSCSVCGKMHPRNYKCHPKRKYEGGEERGLRSTYKWTKKSEEIRERANWLCEVCRDQGRYTHEDLSVHHIDKVREDSTKLLDDENLICLCDLHHKQADSGELSKDYLRELVKKREAAVVGQKN